MFITAMAVTVGFTVLYHLSQKLIPANVYPLTSLAVTFAVALIITLILLPIFPPPTKILDSFRQLNWATIGVAIAIIGVDIGFLLVYRAGWNMSEASLVGTLFVSLILLPIGLYFFKEKLTPVNLAGILICIVGLVMVNWKR